MAYGVKFRLEFSDDNLKGKKIEILKDGYSGSVLSLVGTSDPLEINWEGDDDFYNPIIGSTCTINLFDTDDTSYDDFYTADEREYKVKISYKDSSDVYQTYWEGWLLVDQFQESVLSKPYPITLKAYDGLGSLGGFTAPIDLTSVSQKDLMYYITNILNDINLGFDIYISNDIQKDGASGSDYTVYDQSTISQNSFLQNGGKLRTAKDVLEQILKFTNAKIFQSYGKWYIINNSSYSEQSVKDSSATTANGGTIPTGIRAAETLSLQTDGSEEIKYFIYNSSGVYQSTSTVDVLHTVPSDLQPLNANLTKEYLRPLKEYKIDVATGDNFFDVNRFSNGHFEHAGTGWTLTNSTIDTEFSFKGDRSLKTTSVSTTAGATSVILVNSSGIDVSGNPERADKLTINTYFDSTSGNDRGFRWQIKIVEVGPGATQTKYWNHSSGSWTDTVTVNEQEVDTNRRWKKFTYNLDSYPTAAWEVFVYLYSAYQTTSTSGFTALFFDSLALEYQNIDSDGNRTDIFSKFDLLQFIRKRTADLSGVKTLDGVYITNDKYSRISGNYYRSRDKTNYLKSIEKITSQQIINDYRSFVVRYEGDLYNNGTDPIGPHNKIWINFGTSVLQEPVSCYIDGMNYNVKRNLYSMIMHVPNQNDDETSDFIIKF
jgi:hypothetical protein